MSSSLTSAAAGVMTATSALSSSTGHPQHPHVVDAIPTDADPATVFFPADDELTTASDAVKLELIARGKMLLERYQRQKTSGDGFSLGYNHHFDYKLLQQHVQPPPQFYSDISLLSSTSSSGGGPFQISHQYNGAEKQQQQQQLLLYQSDGGSNNINNSSSSESLVDLNARSSVDPAIEPSSPLGSWSEFLTAQLQSAQLLDAMDEQLQRLTEFVEDEFQTESFVVQLCRSVHRLLQQKRAAEAAIEKFTKEIGPPVFVENDDTEEMVEKVDTATITTTTMSGEEEPVNDKTKKALKWLTQPHFRELVDEETAELQRELDESKLFIDELKTKVHALRTDASSPDTGRSSSESDDEARKLENRLQEKEELVVSLRTSLENVAQDHKNLEQELQRSAQAMQQLEQAAADKQSLLKRAYAVKAKQLDQLCHDVELPAPWQQVVDENGIIYFHQQGNRASTSQLEDPRVPVALSLCGIGAMKKRLSSSSPASPRSASERMEQVQYEEKQAGRASLSPSGGSQYSRQGSSVDLTGCEDISVPPDDGCKHKIDDFATPLPEGWEMRATAAGSVFFVNRHTNVTTWKDPREEEDGDNGNGGKAHRGRRVEELRVKIPSERKQNESSHENTVTSNSPPGFPEEDGVQYFDVVFKERGPIGIHFQANNPDAGATVRRLLPGTAAIETGILRPFDRLIAVNQNPVDTASFRHVMILLQGGLRPLTLTFKRDLNASRRTSGSSPTGLQDGQGLGDADLDEEVVLDSEMEQDRHDGTTTAVYGERRRSSNDLLNRRHSNQDVTGGGRHTHQRHHQDTAPGPQNASTGATRAPPPATASAQHEDDESVADKIITNLFSFFWTPPEPAVTGEVQTV